MYRCEACKKRFNTPKDKKISGGTNMRSVYQNVCPHCGDPTITKIQQYKQKSLF